MSAQPVLVTPRLRLRPFEPDDAAWVHHLAGDERIADVTASIPHPYPLEAAQAWIAGHRACWEEGTGIIYAVEREDAAPIGTVSIAKIEGGRGELGYWIGVPYWGHGYCTEAVRELVRFATRTRGLRQVTARCLTRNPASGAVLRKAGFVHRNNAVAECGYRRNAEPIEIYELEAGGTA